MNMKVKLLTTVLTLLTLLLVPFGMVSRVGAQSTLCDVFPCDRAANPDITIGGVITLVTQLIFVGFIGFGVILIIKGAIKITRSEGDDAKVQEGAQAVKGAMIGLGMVLLGIIGLVVLTAVFNATDLFGTDVEDPKGVEIDTLL